jgi:hypothetical protein
MSRSTYSFVVLELSPAAFEEIRSKLEAAGYQHQFHVEQERTVIDMHGIAVSPPKKAPLENEQTRPSH